MLPDSSNLTASDYAGWWGAITATLALTWNIVVFIRSGARIKIRVNSNIIVFPESPITKGKTYVSVTAINIGKSATTITHFCGYYGKSYFGIIRMKRQEFVINCHPALGNTVPFLLSPGEEWRGLADQGDLSEHINNGVLLIGIIHNQRKRPILKRTKIDKKSNTASAKH